MKKIIAISNAGIISRSDQKSLTGGNRKTRWLCSSNFCGVCATSLAECEAQCYGGTCSSSPVCPLCPIFLD